MSMGKTNVAVALLATIQIVSFAAPVRAQDVPAKVEAYARRLETQCESSGDRGSLKLADARSDDWLKMAVEDRGAKILIVDGGETRCKPVSQIICGTGGCPIAVFRVTEKATRSLFDDQAHGWKFDKRNGQPVLRLQVHGSRCGGFGPTPCETVINLRTGNQRTSRPPA
jgi:hypothetical protein